MTRILVCVLLTAMTALGTEIATPPTSSNQTTTFNKDVLPILQNNCQTCHRPEGVAPMSFLTYESTRPWAKAIKAAVINKKMPPWFADPHVGQFRNAPKLTPADIAKLTAWVDSGAAEGVAADKPAAREFPDGWRIQPDVVVSMPTPVRIEATGDGDVREFFIPNPFKEDTWVTAMEIRPGNPSVVHHVIMQIPEAGARRVVDGVVGGVVRGEGFSVTVCGNCPEGTTQRVVKTSAAAAPPPPPPPAGPPPPPPPPPAVRTGQEQQPGQRGGFNGGAYSDILVRLRERETGRGSFTTMEAVYAPGTQPLDFHYTNSAKLIPGGRPIRLEVHYTPNGKVTTDQTKVAFTLAKVPAQRRFIMMAPEHLVDSRKPIPAGDGNWETRGELTFNQDADLVWFMPHMHLRGKDMTFRLVFPDGREQTVLSTKFNFNWQLGYEVEKPIKLTRGTRMIVTAHHDNSANNPMNPTPGQAVPWGEMTAQEMMLPWFGVVVDRAATPDTIATYRPGDLDGINPQGRVDGALLVPKVALPRRE